MSNVDKAQLEEPKTEVLKPKSKKRKWSAKVDIARSGQGQSDEYKTVTIDVKSISQLLGE